MRQEERIWLSGGFSFLRGSPKMRTIRAKILIFFILCLVSIGGLTVLDYENTISLKHKLIVIENFDDFLEDTLELRRYEKNFIFYRDTASLQECVFYLFKIEDAYKRLNNDIRRVIGQDKAKKFPDVLEEYKYALEKVMEIVKGSANKAQIERFRLRGRDLVDFAEHLIMVKRGRIEARLNRSLIMPLISVGIFFVLIIVVFQLVNKGILKPLRLVERATKEVAKETFVPIPTQSEKKDEISRLIAAFNKMARELESREEQLLQSRKMASIGTFTSGIAHELNNPINNISLIVESLIEDDEVLDHSKRTHLYQDLMNQAERTSDIVKNLLEFSRASHPRLEQASLEELVGSTAQLLKNEFRLSSISFSKEVQDEIPQLNLDKKGFQQVFLNLFLNSIQAMKGGGEIKAILRVVHASNEVRIDVKDTGEGIPPENLGNIFDPFFSTKKEDEGTGLGLSVSYSIIRKHGGRIEVKSEPGQGSCFSIFLPMGGEHEKT
jgi:two-component system NtrC family sensor kinase